MDVSGKDLRQRHLKRGVVSPASATTSVYWSTTMTTTTTIEWHVHSGWETSHHARHFSNRCDIYKTTKVVRYMAVHTTTRAILATTLLFSPSRTPTHTHTHTCAHACTHTCHSCQPLLGVNLSPEFVNLYFPYAGQVLSFFLLVAAAFSIPTGTCGSGRKKQCCAKYTCATSDLTSREIS